MPDSPAPEPPRPDRRGLVSSLILLLLAAALVNGVLRRAQHQPRPGVGQPPAASPAAAPAEPLRNLFLNGSPLAMGRTYGSTCKTAILASWAAAEQAWERAGCGPTERATAVAALQRQLPQTTVDLLAGLAAGSGLEPAQVLALQAWPELQLRQTSCAFAAAPPATRDQELLTGTAFQAPPLGSDSPEPLLLTVREEGMTAYCGLTWPGLVAPLAGLNQQGLTVALLAADDPAAAPAGVPAVILARRLLQEAGDLKAATALLGQRSSPAAVSFVLGQAHPQPAALVWEQRGQRHAERPLERGVVVVTNHLRAVREKPLEGTGAGVCRRYDLLRSWLLDHAGGLSRLSQPLQQAGCLGESNTWQIQLEPGVQRLEVGRSVAGQATPSMSYVWQPAAGAPRAATGTTP
ncbi:MAG: hypothetical protein IT204_13650 [Fimbriimonadaceae bacterium]|nr:hypothetical protein [Fimbriimonadaceae bacterium]